MTEEKKKQFLMTDMALEVGSLDFESNDYSANQLRYETLHGRTITLTSFDDLESYLQSQFDANPTNPEFEKHCPNINQDSLSAEYGQMQCNMQQRNPEFYRYQPYVASENKPFDFVSNQMNQNIDINKQKVSPYYNEMVFYPYVENQKFHQLFKTPEYSQIELVSYERNPLFDRNQIHVLSEYSQMEYYNKEISSQFDTNQQIVSSEDGEMKLVRLENNPQFGTNQLNVSFEYIQIEICDKELNPQFDTNSLTVSCDYDQVECGGHETIPLFISNQQIYNLDTQGNENQHTFTKVN
ncbi:hypothetical protein TNIN_312801 [Trichonephila inaurata madagascariensis]|uniref:Uncharacterized protein n=1 Tax=Trichonephila inaurata madagascariensis TaxID=2747483 RepID=A0A8X7CJN1_9ARAC|nr:hypothetical protein TNIN_312801 [Trichonephila inaurata madagascariensis]